MNQKGALIILSALVAGSAHAVVVNISTLLGQNPVETVQGSLKLVGTTLALPAGVYTITPVAPNHPGALYTAANRFSVVDQNLARGWEWNVYTSLDGGATSVKHGYGEGFPSVDLPYQPTAAAAFAAAPAPFNVTLNTPGNLFLFWRDDIFGDNQGGISVDVQAVPEPASMIALGLGAAAVIRRKRSRR